MGKPSHRIPLLLVSVWKNIYQMTKKKLPVRQFFLMVELIAVILKLPSYLGFHKLIVVQTHHQQQRHRLLLWSHHP